MSQPAVYEPGAASPTFPTLPLKDFAHYVRLGLAEGKLRAIRQFRAWLRDHLKA